MAAQKSDLPSASSPSMWRPASLYVPKTTDIRHCETQEMPSFLVPDGFEGRPLGPRQFRPLRQRTRIRVPGKQELQSPRRGGDEEMQDVTEEPPTETLKDRETLCLPDFARDSILHGGDERFNNVLRQYFPTSESNASERLVDLKAKLRKASTHDFWAILMEEMCDITGAQCGFVSKRMLLDDQDTAVEMPPLGEEGSCLMGVAFYVNNGTVNELYRDYRYHAYGTPCAHMKHDKVFIVPERMTEFVPNNPNQAAMPWKQSEAFIGVPLFSNEGKCFAHFGLIWSSEGAGNRKLGWSFIEMFLHSLEDMIIQRIIDGRGFVKEAEAPESAPAKIIPLSAITAAQSLKPYARSLSHELRTPMQGVVGMLDIMYSTVLDSIANQQSEVVREIFMDLKTHIETVQDSSRRAVEAADNVVHAYDLDMQMPDTPLTPVASDAPVHPPSGESSRKQTPTLDIGAVLGITGTKRERPDDSEFHAGPPLKRMFTVTETDILRKYYPEDVTISCGVCGTVATTETTNEPVTSSDFSQPQTYDTAGSPVITSAMLSPNHQRVVTRNFIQKLVNEAIRSGHPTSEVHTQTELGETIEITNLGSRGQRHERIVCINIESDVPDEIIIEKQHLQFALQKIVDNAIKFTDSGCITITVKLSQSLEIVEIWVVDTGCGMTEESRLNLFKPHFQEDPSISRSRDGLGLSLFNAKAHVRKNLGGDVTLERSDTEGPFKGSEFLVRLPISTFDSDTFDVPLVGTPPHIIQQPLLSSPSVDVKGTLTPRSGTVSPRLVSRKSPSRGSAKRTTFNPNLAKECPLNILIAEDNAINRNVAVASLSKLGYATDNVTIAFDGLEAVRHYKESLLKPTEQQYDAILMDIWMPNMDGYEATKEILGLSLLSQSPKSAKIIAVTADITSDSMARAEAAGMQDTLPKPYKVLELEQLIVKHFQKEGE